MYLVCDHPYNFHLSTFRRNHPYVTLQYYFYAKVLKITRSGACFTLLPLLLSRKGRQPSGTWDLEHSIEHERLWHPIRAHCWINQLSKKLVSSLAVSGLWRQEADFRINYLCDDHWSNVFSWIKLLSYLRAAECKCSLLPSFLYSPSKTLAFLSVASAMTDTHRNRLGLASNRR